MSEDELFELKAAFDFFDSDGSCELDINELSQAMGSLGFHLSEDIMNRLIMKCDKDED